MNPGDVRVEGRAVRVQTIFKVGATALLLLIWPGARATTTFEGPCTHENFEPPNCLDGVSASVTSLDSLRVTGTRATSMGRESQDSEAEEPQARLRSLSGLAAGDVSGGWAAWGSAGYSDFESDVQIAPYDAKQIGWLAGVDRMVSDRLLLGVALGYENTDSNTFYNGGGTDTDGFTVAPYLAFLINDNFSFDLTVGYTALDTDQDRIDTQNGSALTSSFDADRAFGAANLNAVLPKGNWVFGGRIGALLAGESQDGYTEVGGPDIRTVGDRNLDLGQVYIGVDVGYAFDAFEPYAIGFYRNDFKSDDGGGAGLPGDVGSTATGDDDEFQWGLGVRYFGERASGTFEWLRTEDRDSFDEDTFTLTVRVAF